MESNCFYHGAYLPSFMPSVPFPPSRQKGIIAEPEVGKGRKWNSIQTVNSKKSNCKCQQLNKNLSGTVSRDLLF